MEEDGCMLARGTDHAADGLADADKRGLAANVVVRSFGVWIFEAPGL